MNTELIWVHKRHADYPAIQVGFRWVTPEIAARMITDECAQPKGTDNKKLRYKTEEVFKPEPVAAPEPPPAPEPPEPVTESAEDEAPKPKPRRRTYKRRDITAES